MAVHHVAVDGTHVEVEELGAGESVVVVQTALTMRELEPLCRSLGAEHHVWHVHRPGYGASGPARTPGSIGADAELVASVMEQLGVGSAHLVGASYSAAVVLTLASRYRDRARSVVAVEPPPHGTPGAADFRAANERLREVYATSGAGRALDQVMQIVDGPDWRVNAERDLRGSVAEMERDARTFFASDVPALLGWRLDDGQAATIACPTLLVGGGDSHPWFAEMLDRLDRVLPGSARVTIDGAGHTAALTHVDEVARVIREHLRTAVTE